MKLLSVLLRRERGGGGGDLLPWTIDVTFIIPAYKFNSENHIYIYVE